MTTQYPNAIDNLLSLQKVFDGISPIVADDVNRLRDAIVAIETELGVNPSSVSSTVKERIDNLAVVLGSTVFGSGTDGYISYWDGVSSQTADLTNVFYWDDTSGYLGIGTSNPQQKLDVNGRISLIETIEPSTPTAGSGFLYARNDGYLYWKRDDDAEFNLTIDNNIQISGLPVDNQLAIWSSSNIVEGDANLTWNGTLFSVGGDLLPGANDGYLLGNNGLRWKDGYFGPGSIHIGSSFGDEGTLSYNTSSNDFEISSAGTVSITSNLDAESGIDVTGSNLTLADNISAQFGSDADFSIVHTGSATQLTNATGILQIDGTAGSSIVVNGAGNDVDLRAEGSSDPNILFVNAGENRFQISTNSNFTETDSNLAISGVTTIAEVAAPNTPDSGWGFLYANSADGYLYWKNDDGYAFNLAAGTGGGGGGNISGSGVDGYLTYWTDSSTIAADIINLLYWDDANGRLGLFTDNPSYPLDIRAGTLAANTPAMLIEASYADADGYASHLSLNNFTDYDPIRISFGTETVGTAVIESQRGDGSSGTGGYLSFKTRPSGDGAYEERMRITNAGIIGIGTATPDSDSHLVVVEDNASAVQRLRVFSNTTTHESTIALHHSGGTEASVAATPDNAAMGSLTWVGYATADNGGARIRVVADGTWSGSNSGTEMFFETIPNGSSALIERQSFLATEGVFNEGGENYDFRFEGDADQELLFINGGENRVQISSNTDFTETDSSFAISGVTTIAEVAAPNTPDSGWGFLYADSSDGYLYWKNDDGYAFNLASGSGGGGGGSGNVSSTGTPVDNQVAIWTNATTIEGDANFTWDGSVLTITGDILPGTNDTYNLGSDSARWKDGYFGPDSVHIGTNTLDEARLSYNTTSNYLEFYLQDVEKLRIEPTFIVASDDIRPVSDGNYDLGSFSYGFRTLYINNITGPTSATSVELRKSLLPETTNSITLGDDALAFSDGYFANVWVDDSEGTRVGIDGYIVKDHWSSHIETAANKTYYVVNYANYPGEITGVVTESSSGTATGTVEINGVALGGTANSISSTQQIQEHSSTNTFIPGNEITFVISSNSSAIDVRYTLLITRSTG